MAAAEEVDVEVGDCLAAVGTVVDDDAEAVFADPFFLGDAGDAGHHVAEESLIVVFGEGDAGDWLSGDEEEVGGGTGVDVAEAEAELVFVDDVGGDFAVGDFLEESFAGHGGVGVRRVGIVKRVANPRSFKDRW